MMMNLLPLARSPMDKGSARSLDKYRRDMDRMLRGMVPWLVESRREALIRSGVEPGEVVVMLDGSDSGNSAIYKDAKKVRG